MAVLAERGPHGIGGMPGMDGYELARRIRVGESPATGRTDWGREEDRGASMAAGFEYRLVKPVGIEEIQPVLVTLRKAWGSSNRAQSRSKRYQDGLAYGRAAPAQGRQGLRQRLATGCAIWRDVREIGRRSLGSASRGCKCDVLRALG
jgi:CheY-like chemotaxis protein